MECQSCFSKEQPTSGSRIIAAIPRLTHATLILCQLSVIHSTIARDSQMIIRRSEDVSGPNCLSFSSNSALLMDAEPLSG